MNLPNRITLIRILMIPLVVFFYLASFIPFSRLIAFLLFVIAACTDFVDGMIARKKNMITDLGKLLDPIADKCLVVATLLLVVAWPVAGGLPIVSSNPNWVGVIGIVGAIIILAREFIVSALRMIAASKGVVLKADQIGRVKTFIQDVALGGYMFYAFLVTEFALSKTLNAIFGILMFVLFAVSVVLTVISGAHYLIKNKNVFIEEKKQEKSKENED